MSETPFWVATKQGNRYILTEHYGMKEKVFSMHLKSQEFSITRKGKTVTLGQLLRVDLSPEALVEGLDIREGDKVLLLPAGSRGRVP